MGVAMTADERLLTVPEVAERLRVSEYTVRDWLRTGRLQGLRPGGPRVGWRVRSSALERFLTESERDGAED
jgi:excisionase family DNA binding protein